MKQPQKKLSHLLPLLIVTLVITMITGMGLATKSAYAAELGLPAVSVSTAEDGEQTYTLSIQVLALMTALTFLPAALMMMTSFTRIIIVLAIVRQAIGLAQTPSNQVLIGLALFLTIFVMYPVFDKIYQEVVKPYIDEKITFAEAIPKAAEPFRTFMLNQTRSSDLALFSQLSEKTSLKELDSQIDTGKKLPVIDNLDADSDVDTRIAEKESFAVVLASFVTSELKTAFQIGFMIFIPFLIIDLVVASVLMSMGMMMLSPMIISIPFKIMLFVLIDGWSLIMGTLASSFYI